MPQDRRKIIARLELDPTGQVFDTLSGWAAYLELPEEETAHLIGKMVDVRQANASREDGGTWRGCKGVGLYEILRNGTQVRLERCTADEQRRGRLAKGQP